MVWLGLVTWNDVIKESLRYHIIMSIVRQGAHFTFYAISALLVFLLIYTYKEKDRSALLLILVCFGAYAILD